MDTIAGRELSRLLFSSGRQDRATLACYDAFTIHANVEFNLDDLSTESTLNTFRIRFGRPAWDPATVLGSERFLDDVELASEPAMRVAMLVFEGLVFDVWLDSSANRVVSCMVGRDRRDKNRQDRDWSFTGSR
jgi:hypothetical protein